MVWALTRYRCVAAIEFACKFDISPELAATIERKREVAVILADVHDVIAFLRQSKRELFRMDRRLYPPSASAERNT